MIRHPTDGDPPIGPGTPPQPGRAQRFLDAIEWAGNKLPDPAMLFVVALLATWLLSLLLSPVQFTELDPRTVERDEAG
jgi:aminobenzoyl-glutamate transport protein